MIRIDVATRIIDVADDEPEETHVFRLGGASHTIVEDILERHAPAVSEIDRRRIAEFSGGNACIALALAKTVFKHGSFGSLSDIDLFKKLFQQNRGTNEALLRAAEVCSLAYSFDGETLDGPDAELPVLASLIDICAATLYRFVVELLQRDLAQGRGKWRAVLPQAVANGLTTGGVLSGTAP